MKILVTGNQLKTLILKEQEEQEEEIVETDCVPNLPKSWNQVDYSLKDIQNGGILYYGDEDPEKFNALKLIQRKVNSINNEHYTLDGKYGPNLLKRLSIILDIDLCKQKNNDIPIGPNTLKKLGLYTDITEENKEDYILASTLIGEQIKGNKDELFAILSTIKNRSKKCKKSMEEMVLLNGQYNTWDHYNELSEDEKTDELHNRVANQKSKGVFNNMLKIVKEFKNTTPLPYNHYVANYLIKNIESKTDSIFTSYKNNKDSSEKIGLHTFWWDDEHRCN
jgi:hypothetical protein